MTPNPKTFDSRQPNAKRLADEEAKFWTFATGQRHVVEYRDHYNDYSVSGDYIVKPA